MFHTSVIHNLSAFLPIYFGGSAIILFNAGRIFKKKYLKRISYRLYMLTSLVTTFTCGFGGASIRAAESAPGVNSFIVKTHAWSAMLVFLLSAFMFYYSFKSIRNTEDTTKYDNRLNILSVAFLMIFTFTTIWAFKIR